MGLKDQTGMQWPKNEGEIRNVFLNSQKQKSSFFLGETGIECEQHRIKGERR
jgi:hypothetical protein